MATETGQAGGFTARPTDAEREAFAAYGRSLMIWIYPRLGLLVAGALVVWWPFDLLVFSRTEVQTTYAEARVVLIGVTLALAAAVAWAPFARRWPAPTCTAAVAIVAALTAHYMALTGTLDGPWFHFLYGCPLLSIPLVVRPAGRAAAAAAISLAAWSAFVVTRPETFDSLYHGASVSFLAFATVLSVVLGHVSYQIVRSNFLHRTRLAAEQAELRRLNESLGSIIDARTSELRRLTQHVERVREEERRWIAHEIHDDLGQELAALRLALAVARDGAKDSPPTTREYLDDIATGFDRIADTMRRILRGLRPAVLDQMGAVEAVRWLARETSDRGELQVEVQVTPATLELTGERGTTVFRIVQEALTNVVRHARARRATVSIREQEGGVEVLVTDDGVGMDLTHGSQGLGLVTIRERARALGGSAVWTRRKGGGTRVTVSLPAAEPAAAAPDAAGEAAPGAASTAGAAKAAKAPNVDGAPAKRRSTG